MIAYCMHFVGIQIGNASNETEKSIRVVEFQNTGNLSVIILTFVKQLETPFHAKKAPTNIARMIPIIMTLIEMRM